MFSEKRHSGHRMSKTPATPTTPATMEEPSHVDDSTPQRPPSRLKRMSDATARRLSTPLSMLSRRSSTSSRPPTPDKLHKPASRTSAASRPSHAERPESSKRSSLLSNGASPVAHDEDERLGELPVFRISRRAYLASLMSLFMNGNDTPRSASTPITEPDSNAPSLGPYEYDIHSSAIYKYSKSRRLYVGWPELVHPPPEALLEFEMETLPLLERDLQGVSGHLGQQGIRLTYELRMSGYARATAETVSLSPTVWILYRAGSYAGAQTSIAELHQAVADIFYLQNGLEIQEGGGRMELTSDRGLVNVSIEEKESIKMSGGGKLSVHMEDCHDKHSVCGALCCVTTEEGSRRVQSLCRIGGLLKINGKYILGVSTAHGMLDGSDIFKDSFDDTAPTHVPVGHAADRDIILAESKRVAKWHNATRDAAVDFLGVSMNSRGEMAIKRSKPENATDFALLRLRKMPTYVRNKYMPPGVEEAVSITSTASASAAAMDEGSVHIICSGGDVEGQLVWGSAGFVVRGRNFRVRRIQTSRPLSASTTGSWVVRGEVLYGCIIGVYENEPFALMMTVERLFASILGSAFSIRTVELWDGEVTETLKTYASAELTKTTDNTAPQSTRRRAQTDTRANQNGEGPSMNGAQDSTHDNCNGEGSSKNPSNLHEVNGNGANPISSESTQPLSLRPQVVDESTPNDEPDPPREGSAVSRNSQNNAEEVAPTRRIRAKRTNRGRPGSHTSNMTMSGASQDHRPGSKGKQRAHTGDSEMSTGAKTTYTTASETLERQDSGFDSEAPPARTDETVYEKDMHESHDFADQLAGEALGSNLDGGASRNGDSARRSEDETIKTPGTYPTGTAPKSRKGNLQNVLGKAFRRSSGDSENQGRSQDDRHGSNGMPPTGSSKRRSVFARSRSSNKDPKPVSRDNKFGIPPTSRNGRPLSFFGRSTGKSTEVEQSNNDTGAGSSPSGDRARPSSFIRQPAGESRQPE